MANVAVSLKIQQHPFPSKQIRSPAGQSEPGLGGNACARGNAAGGIRTEYKNALDLAARSALRDQTKGKGVTSLGGNQAKMYKQYSSQSWRLPRPEWRPLIWGAPDQGLRLVDSEGEANHNRHLRWQPSDCQLSLQGSKSSTWREGQCLRGAGNFKASFRLGTQLSSA
jgi:hypothetical protein